jgi:hypothetical protein
VRRWQGVLLSLFGLVQLSSPAWAWFAEGHEIVGIIAADDLTSNARSHVSQIFHVPADTRSIEKAAASIRPDTEFREEDRSTAQWHYIDICLQDTKKDLSARCPHGNCVTAKIDEYARRLHDRDYDKWGAVGDLAFLIHLVGDIHQPLHTTTNADRGGTCQRVNVTPAEDNLHYAWDDAVVAVLEKLLGTTEPEATARKLEALYPDAGDLATWKPRVGADCMGIASTGRERRLSCARDTGEAVFAAFLRPRHEHTRDAEPDVYGTRRQVAGRQLSKAGHRLAALLIGIWASSH